MIEINRLRVLIEQGATIKSHKGFVKLNKDCKIIHLQEFDEYYLTNGKRGWDFQFYPIEKLEEIKKYKKRGNYEIIKRTKQIILRWL